jgi:hypothetical protein
MPFDRLIGQALERHRPHGADKTQFRDLRATRCLRLCDPCGFRRGERAFLAGLASEFAAASRSSSKLSRMHCVKNAGSGITLRHATLQIHNVPA